MNILIVGATGFVGKALTDSLISDGHKIEILVRNKDKAEKDFIDVNVSVFGLDSFFNSKDFLNKKFDICFNLAGENISSKKWSNERKKQIYNSRVDLTENLISRFKELNISVTKFIQASAIGIYKSSSDPLDESSSFGNDFLSKVCVNWEKALLSKKEIFSDYTIIRTGLVLGKNGGVMDKMLKVFKLGFGGKLGSGNQYMSWIHLEDLIRIYKLSMEEGRFSGVVNAVSPFYVTNNEFTNTLGGILRKKTILNVPTFILSKGLGEMSTILLSGSPVISKVLKNDKFHYRYPTLKTALKEVASKTQ